MHDASDSNSEPDMQLIQAEDAARECERQEHTEGNLVISDVLIDTSNIQAEICSHARDDTIAAVSELTNVNQQVDCSNVHNFNLTVESTATQSDNCPLNGNVNVVRKYIAWKCILYCVIFVMYCIFTYFHYDLLIDVYVRNQISDDTPMERVELYNLLHSKANQRRLFESLKSIHIYYLIGDCFDCFLTVPFGLLVPILPFILSSNHYIRRGLFGFSNLVVTKTIAEFVVELHLNNIEPSGTLICFLSLPIPYAIAGAMCFPDTTFGRFVLPVQRVQLVNSKETDTQSLV